MRKLQSNLPSRTIRWEFVNLIEPDPLRRVKLRITHEKLEELHPADLADIMEDLSAAERQGNHRLAGRRDRRRGVGGIGLAADDADRGKARSGKGGGHYGGDGSGRRLRICWRNCRRRLRTNCWMRCQGGSAGSAGTAGVRSGHGGRNDEHGFRVRGRSVHVRGSVELDAHAGSEFRSAGHGGAARWRGASFRGRWRWRKS